METKSYAAIIIFLLFHASASFAAIEIDGGPTWTPPGAGAESGSGDGIAFEGGRTYTYSGIDLSQTENLYYGIKNDLYVTGFSTDGHDISGTEIFIFSHAGGNTIVYTGSSIIETSSGGTYTQPTRMTLTFSGPGVMVQDATTAGLGNPLGDVGALWQVLGDFSFNILVEAQVQEQGDSNYLGWEPGNDLFNRLDTVGISAAGTGSSFDTGFWYETLPPVPGIDMEKRTNGRQADSADDPFVPRIAPGESVIWTYDISNTGEVAFPEAEVAVTDSQPGVTPVLDPASDDGDMILSPGETWSYLATGTALDLASPPVGVTVVPGCGDDRNTYQNTGRADISSAGLADEDLSHYCNPSDKDNDGILDEDDNCVLVPNGPLDPDAGGNIQRDTDGDGFGNICDPDFDGNLTVDFSDLAFMKSVFFTPDPDADLDGNGSVDFADLAIQKSMFFGPPGPSGLVP